MRIRTAAVVLALTAASALTGCGGEEESSPAPRVLSEEQIRGALLTVSDVGTGFAVKEDDDEEDPDLGCLNALEAIEDGFAGAVRSLDVAIEATAEPMVPEVGNQINAFADEAAATKALADFAATFEGCTAVNETNDGFTATLEVETDDATSTPEVDQQFNLDMRGIFAGEGAQLPVSQRAKFLRIGNVITAVYLGSFETSTSDETENLAELVVAKILPVLEGKAPGTPAPLNLEPFTG